MIQIGMCPICGDEFMRGGRPLANHIQIMVVLSNDDTMYVAICRKHSITNKLLADITAQTLKFMSDETDDENMKNKYDNLTFKERV